MLNNLDYSSIVGTIVLLQLTCVGRPRLRNETNLAKAQKDQVIQRFSHQSEELACRGQTDEA